MLVRFLKEDDKRLEEVLNFEIQTIDHDNGEIVDTEWVKDTTFNAVIDSLQKKHIGGIESSILDDGEELRAIITPRANSIKYYYAVLVS